MKTIVFVVCLCTLASLSFAARGAGEIKGEMAALKQNIKATALVKGNVHEMKRELAKMNRELFSVKGHRANRLDSGGETCDDATPISGDPFYDFGTIDETTTDNYVYSGDCGLDGSELVYSLTISPDGLPEGYYTMTTCGSWFDTVIELWSGCPNSDGSWLVACNDDAGEGSGCEDDNSGLSSCISDVYLEPGTYYLVIFGFDFSLGDYALSVGLGLDCAGNGSSCTGNADNSTCGYAEELVLDGGSAYATGASYNGGDYLGLPYCGTEPGACGLWYEVVGTGNTMSVTTCNEATNYDTKINVYTGDCSDLICVDGNDDWGYYDEEGNWILECEINEFASYVEWCSVAGQSYFIFVNGWNGETGDFGLWVQDSGQPCEPPCYWQDYYFTVDQVPFCQCLHICPGQTQKIFVGPATELQRPVATWSMDCSGGGLIPGACSSDCYPAYPELAMDWIYLADRQLWCMDIYSDQGGCYCYCVDRLLPVELNSFTAVAGDGQVALNWSTGSETNLDHFEIMRGSVSLTQIAASNSATGSTYSWTDESAENGTNYTYTLVAVNLNGARDNLATQAATPQLGASVVSEFALSQNYPNPFNPETNISFSLPEVANVDLRVFNSLGQEVAVLANGTYNAGQHVVKFNGQGLSSGVYFYTLKAGSFTAQHKMLLLK